MEDLSRCVYVHHVARCDGTLRALRLLQQHREDDAYTLLLTCFDELQRGWADSALLGHTEPSEGEESCWFDAHIDALAALGQWQVSGGVTVPDQVCVGTNAFTVCDALAHSLNGCMSICSGIRIVISIAFVGSVVSHPAYQWVPPLSRTCTTHTVAARHGV